MSTFRELQETHLLDYAEPLVTSGSTCLCYKVKVYDRWQFVKRLRPELQQDQRYISLFRKEFAVGSKLSHPNLIRYNEMEMTDEGLYMLLDYVEGHTLTDVLEQEPKFFAKKDRLYRFTSQLLSALEYLHNQQILHLDLKPDNIMITRVNEDVRILDLGFCRTDSFALSVGMSEEFSAPEQRDKTGVLDASTDLFALGKILEKIEHTQREKLPAVYRKLMSHCLQQEPKKRLQHASEGLRMLQSRRVLTKALCATAVLLTVSLGLYFFEPTREFFEYHFRHFQFRSYQWTDHCCQLHILSDAEMTCQLVGWETDEGPNLLIPASSNFYGHEYRVVSVADTALIECQTLETLFIPEGVERIGERAFYHCSNIATINLPNSVKQLGDGCFAACYGLKNLHLSESLTMIAPRAFHACTSLERVDIPEGVTRLGTDCFVADSALVQVTLPTSLEIIDRGVFFLCRQIPSVTLPASLKSIGDYAFYYCDALVEITCLAETPPSVLESFRDYDITLKVPAESIEKYQKHPVWGRMKLETL